MAENNMSNRIGKVCETRETRALYEVERLKASIDIDTYIEEYVNIEEFLECCKACPNYAKVWSCPPYDFDVLEFWKKFSEIEFFGIKICFDMEEASKYSYAEVMEKSLFAEKQKLTEELWQVESQNEGSVSLSAGSCQLCKECTRQSGEPCKHRDKMRYSIESLGGNVGKTCTKLLGVPLLWSEEGKVPEYFVLVGAVLRK